MADFRDWYWSSYQALTGKGPARLKRDEVLGMFGGIQAFEAFHRGRLDEKKLAELIDDEFDLETDLT